MKLNNLHIKLYLITLLCFQIISGVIHAGEQRVTFYHNDAFNSPIAATNESGNVVWNERYAPFGEPQLNEAAKKTGIDYTGHVYDKELGLHYMGARYYDPVVGRFMSNDPVGFVEGNPMSFNRYAYANNNPYMYYDPDGELPVAFIPLAIWAAISLTGDTPAERGISSEQQFISELIAPVPPLLKVLQGSKVGVAVNKVIPKVNMGKQGKHIPGHNNYQKGKSVLTGDPQKLAQKAGTGQPVNSVPRGQAGFKERVDFGETIGDFVQNGVATPTTKGILTYAKDGRIHIIPARP